jgi:methyl-accepting chemotaxis protein
MGESWTFGRKLAFGFSLAALTLLVIAGFGYQTTQHLIENDRWVTHTTSVREGLARLVSTLTDAETGQRGFVITGKDDFLEPHTRAVSEIERHFAEIRTLTNDNPNQQRRLNDVRPLIDEKLGELKRTIDLRRAEGFGPTQAVVAEGQGKRAMDAIRRIVFEMDREELELLGQRHREAEAAAQTARNVILWGSLLGTAFVAIVGFLIAQSLSKQIGSAVRHIQSSSAELQSAANQQATGSKEQATAMAEITTTISELLATAKQIAESARRVSGIADDTAKAAVSGNQLVQRTSESIGAIQRQVDLIVSHMLDLGRKSQQIGGFLELINELAEQTNILAINATIEAAGAGETGKRFAVVAEEIRRLADRVGVSTKEIRQLIDDIRTAVNKTVMTTEGGNKAVEAGARQFAEVTTSLGQISSMVATTTDAAREIELSTKQQSTAVEQVNVAVANVAQASKETEASSNQTLQTASELAVLSRDLLKVVQSEARA